MPRLKQLPCAVKITMGWMVYHWRRWTSPFKGHPPPWHSELPYFFHQGVGNNPPTLVHNAPKVLYWTEICGGHRSTVTSLCPRLYELCDMVHCSARKLHQEMPYLKLGLVRAASSSRSPIVQLWRVCERSLTFLFCCCSWLDVCSEVSSGTSDLSHQRGIFVHTTAAHWIFSPCFRKILCKPQRWLCENPRKSAAPEIDEPGWHQPPTTVPHSTCLNAPCCSHLIGW